DAHGFPHLPARDHDPGGTQRNVGDAHVAPREEQILEAPGVQAPQGDVVHAGNVVAVAGVGVPGAHALGGVAVQVPAAVGHRVGEVRLRHDVPFGEDVIAHDAAGFPLARERPLPIEGEAAVGLPVVGVVFQVVPDA